VSALPEAAGKFIYRNEANDFHFGLPALMHAVILLMRQHLSTSADL
jgi:hypothetical protein